MRFCKPFLRNRYETLEEAIFTDCSKAKKCWRDKPASIFESLVDLYSQIYFDSRIYFGSLIYFNSLTNFECLFY